MQQRKRPGSEFSLPNIEHYIASKRNSVISRYLDSKSKEELSFLIVLSPYFQQEDKVTNFMRN